jgi:hypothetical protein
LTGKRKKNEYKGYLFNVSLLYPFFSASSLDELPPAPEGIPEKPEACELI